MKNKIILLFTLLVTTSICQAQIKAVTETGEEVILYQNATWKYLKESLNNDSIKINNTVFTKSKNSSFLLKSKNGNLGFWIDPKKWSFKKAQSNTEGEYELALKEESLQALILTESGEIPIEAYPSIVLENARIESPDIQLTKKEYRNVNGLRVLYLQMEGTRSGMEFVFAGYYYSNSNGTVQFLTYTYKSLLQKYKQEIEELLNGLVQLRNDQSMDENSASQGSFSTFNNCKQYFIGNWEYYIIDQQDLKNKKVNVERTLYKTFEYLNNKMYYFEYDTKWISECKYELTFVKTNKPHWTLIKKGEKITVEILLINNNEMEYSTTFKGVTNNGKMNKIK